VYLPEQGCDPEDLLARGMSPPLFPIRPKELGSGWAFHALEVGQHEIEGFAVRAEEIPHKGGRTFGYRVSAGSATIAYLSDHSPLAYGPGPDGLGEYHPAAMALADGADVLIHDAQHTAAELPRLAFLGHSAVEYAVGLARRCGVGTLVLFHHDPWRTDDEIDGLVASVSEAGVRVIAAYDGMVLEISFS
jgi:phosphoribosyl 1,2-cyclic phosphodiesterase